MPISFNAKEFNSQINDIHKKLDESDKDVLDEATNIITTVTDKLEEESVKRAPVDEGFLEKSHQKKVEKAGFFKKIIGRVFIPANSPAADYAMYMHEMEYKLGPRSQAKQDADPTVKVGRKYLERAMKDNERGFGLYIVRKLKELLK